MSDSATGRDSPQFLLRLPEALRDRVKDAARDNKRSMNAEIVARLETSFQEPTAVLLFEEVENMLHKPGVTGDEITAAMKRLASDHAKQLVRLMSALEQKGLEAKDPTL